MNFKEKYGPVALVAGASSGLGAAFAHALAARGLDLVIVARRKDLLEETAGEISLKYSVRVIPVTADLADPEAAAQISDAIGQLPIHFLVYNAAASYIGPFLDLPSESHAKNNRVNTLNPLMMIHRFAGNMIKNKRGGILLMSSLAGLQGSGYLASYAAGKAFNRILAESLWYEWKPKGVDVMACCAGSISTQNYLDSNPKNISALAPKAQRPEAVVEECLRRIGKTPSFIPGTGNKLAAFFMQHIFPRKKAIRLISDTTRKMYEITD